VSCDGLDDLGDACLNPFGESALPEAWRDRLTNDLSGQYRSRKAVT
jgi:hypothetical protein